MTQRYTVPLLSFLLPLSSLAQGDSCTTALAVDPGSFVADGPTTGAAASQGDAVNADWYAFTPVVDGFFTVVSCGSLVDTRVNVHEGSCGGLALLATDDDGCPDAAPLDGSLVANLTATPGTTYYIEWDDHHTGEGFAWELLLHGCPIAIPTITSGPGSIILDWPVLAAGATFTIEYGPPGFVPGTGTVITGVQGDVEPPVTITGLTGGAEYDIYISIDCGGGNTAPFIGPWHGTAGEPVVIENEDCEGAILITCGSSTSGSTALALDDAAPDCGTSISAPGIWYTFTGVSGTVMLSTCADPGYDSKINVYTGACDDPECVTGNDDGPFGCYPGSEVIMTADAATTYLVLVQGYDGDVGTFTLNMDCLACAPPENIFATPADTQALLYWDPANPGGAFTVEYGPAGFALGTGTLITGTVGTDGPPVTMTGLAADTDYDAYLTESCVGGEQGETRGPVTFTTLVDPLAANAFCSDAAAITCGSEVDGNTEEAIFSPAPECGSGYVNTPGLWYTFTGDGNDVTLSTCNAADFDTKISVWSGSCANLVCEGGVDDAAGCDVTSSLTIATVSGTTYYVMVHGFDGEVGSFTLSMTCAAPCSPVVANDDCASAQEIEPQPIGACVPTQGTNVCAYTPAQPNPPCDPYSAAFDVWYSFNTGPSPDHTITVASISSGGLGVALYTGCVPGTFVDCYDPQAGPIALTGLELNTVYYLQVWNSGGADAGTFTICDEAPSIESVGEGSLAGGLRAWPIPVEDVLVVEGLANGARTLRLMDAQGRLVMQQRVERDGTQFVNTSALTPGAYVLRVEGEMPQAIRLVRR